LPPAFLAEISMDECDWRRRLLVGPSTATQNLKRHWSISMVEEPTKTLRGALAFFRGASCSIKTRDPIKQDRTIDFAIARRIVNATNKNKRFSFERRRF
jgi:hypothetical protein